MSALLVAASGREWRFDPGGPAAVVGRDPLCHVVVDDTRVSREHLALEWLDGHWWVRDLGSSNGTFVDGLRVDRVPVEAGRTLRLGDADGGATLTVRPAEAPVIAPVGSVPATTTGPVVPGPAGAPAPAPPRAPAPAQSPAQSPAPPQAPAPSAPPLAPSPPWAPTPAPPPGAETGPVTAFAPVDQGPAGPAEGDAVTSFAPFDQGVPAAPAAPPTPAAPPVRPDLSWTPALPGGDRAASTAGPGEQGRAPSAVHRVTERVRIGRTPDNDIVLTDLLVSRHHAELRRTGAGYEVVDLGTRNGTFVNGQRVAHAVLQQGDLISAGHHQFVFDGNQLREYVDSGRVSLRAEGLTVTVGGKALLRDVTFDLDESSLLAVVGPSGAGKSTLLGALTGIRPAGKGVVRYENRDLYAEYDDLRHRIGLVPQDDILHRQLTVRRALRYAAALRFGSDVSAAEREQRIDEVLAKLGLTERADQRISTLSGGQRKRTSVGLELLTEPSLLFLDEPTSGLDPALDRDVMLALRDLADGGRTVCVVTHSVLHLNVCDRVLVLGRGGVVCYFGPPDALLGFFGAREYAEVFEMVASTPERWADRYAEHVAAAVAPPTREPVAAPGEPSTGAAPARQGFWRQLSIVARRTAAVTAADRLYGSLLVGLPLGLAALVHVVPGSAGLAPPHTPLGRSVEAGQLLTIMVIGAVFMGLAGGIRELVSERAIYRRERAVGLSPGAYLGAKLAVFAVVNTAQAVLFVLIALWGRRRPDEALVLGSPTAELVAVIALVTVTSTALGLLVSAYVSTSEQTMPVLVGLVMAQLVLCGGLFAVVDRVVIAQLSWLTPARWAFAAVAATVDLRSIMVDPPDDGLWKHTAGSWLFAVGAMVAQVLVLLVATRLALRRHDPGR